MEPSSVADLWRQIRSSAGAAYYDRANQRSFSLNVFQMNAVELMEAAQRVKDPDQGMALMSQRNRDAGRQAHRELNRHVHNFVSSALTLVEHTRVFMREHYAGTALLTVYEKYVTATFAQSPVAQFVQGLRNYMLHRGLPNSSMFMNFRARPGATDGAGTMETGVHYDTASLLDWKDWKAMARTYLEKAGEHLDVHQFAQEYLTLVNQFHGWLDATLAEHHQTDIKELGKLQARLHAISPTRSQDSVAPSEAPVLSASKRFEFNSEQASDLIQKSSHLFGKIRELHFQQDPQGFPTERPTTEIAGSDLIGHVTGWGHEKGGGAAFMFFQREGKDYGFTEEDYGALDGLIDAAMKSTWAHATLSRVFVKNVFFDWARNRIEVDEPSFSEALSAAARASVTAVEVWAPIAHLEIEHGFEFGSVRIEPITSAAIDKMRSGAPCRPEQEMQVSELFERLKHEIQGFAAVVVSMEAEPELAKERGLRMAQDAVGLLSFFSPAAPRPYFFSPVALAGAEYIPKSTLIVLREGGFSHTQSILPKHVGYWRLTAKQISDLKSGALNVAASLVVPEGLSEFALAVRASFLTYGKGMTLTNPMDRLRNCLSALEGIFLKHEMEPRAHSIANRISFLLAPECDERERFQQIVRQIYWLDRQPHVLERNRREDELIAVFTSCAYRVLYVALSSTSTFSSKIDFVTEVDRLGLSSQ